MHRANTESKPVVGTRELRDNMKQWLHRADREPVTVTVNGYERHVIVSIDQWRKLTGQRA